MKNVLLVSFLLSLWMYWFILVTASLIYNDAVHLYFCRAFAGSVPISLKLATALKNIITAKVATTDKTICIPVMINGSSNRLLNNMQDPNKARFTAVASAERRKFSAEIIELI